MSALSDFYLASPPTISQFDCLEVTHLDFSQDYFLVRNNTDGISVLHEGAVGPFEYEYCPMKVLPVGTGQQLDQEVRITLGDVGEIIATEIGNIQAANSMIVKPTLKFRTYRSDALTVPLFGPLTLQISKVQSTIEGSSFIAHAKFANVSRTGAAYTIQQFPPMRAFR